MFKVQLIVLCSFFLLCASLTFASDLELMIEAIVLFQPFLPGWAQLALVLTSGVYGVFTSVIRPHIKPDDWVKLGKTGRVLDQIAGNRKHTENK